MFKSKNGWALTSFIDRHFLFSFLSKSVSSKPAENTKDWDKFSVLCWDNKSERFQLVRLPLRNMANDSEIYVMGKRRRKSKGNCQNWQVLKINHILKTKNVLYETQLEHFIFNIISKNYTMQLTQIFLHDIFW
jgi:hypothetical protein